MFTTLANMIGLRFAALIQGGSVVDLSELPSLEVDPTAWKPVVVLAEQQIERDDPELLRKTIALGLSLHSKRLIVNVLPNSGAKEVMIVSSRPDDYVNLFKFDVKKTLDGADLVQDGNPHHLRHTTLEHEHPNLYRQLIALIGKFPDANIVLVVGR